MATPNPFGTTKSNGTSPRALPPLWLPKHATAVEAADAVVGKWRDVDGALRPIIGQRGVVALFDRSVHLTAASHPWLVSGGRDALANLDLTALRTLLSEQPVATVLACGNDLLLTLHQLLTSLIGASLTERLLRSAWRHTSDGTLTQDLQT